MRQSFGRKRTIVGSVPTDVGSRIAGFLRQIHPINTAKAVSLDTGIPVSTVEKLIERQSAPNGGGFVALTMAYGLDFLSAVSPNVPEWLERAVSAERLAQLEADHARIGRELEALRR